MKDIKIYLHDIIKAFLCGVATAVIIGVISLIIGLFVSNFNAKGVVNTIRAGLLISGSLSLFMVAGLLLMKKDVIVKHVDSWRKQFKKLNFVHVLSLAGAAVLATAIIFDYATLALQ